PTPRKLSADSARMSEGTVNEASTSIVGSTLGSTYLRTIPDGRTPTTFAASTYSLRLIESASPRISRESPGHETSANMNASATQPGEYSVEMSIRSGSDGI